MREVINQLPNLETIAWVQEEPQNQGAWSFVYPYLSDLASDQYELQYSGRIKRSAPAEGDGENHKLVQNSIIEESLNKNREIVCLRL